MEKILLIDDDDQVCSVVGEFLRRHQYNVTTASTGAQGLMIAAKTRPDLIICDLDMPGLNGQGVVTALRQDERLGDIPIIFLSGCNERGRIRQSMNLGGDDFIIKPAALPEILDTVKARLQRHHRQQQKLDQRLEKAVEVFVGVINDLKRNGPNVQWLAETGDPKAGPQDQLIRRIRQSWESTKPTEAPPPASATPATNSLLVKFENRQQFVKLSEVKALMAYGEYSNVHWGKEHYMMFRKPLKVWQVELPQDQFVRIHRQAIINLSFLDFVEQDAQGKMNVHLREFKQVIPVSQRATPVFKRCLKQFQARKP